MKRRGEFGCNQKWKWLILVDDGILLWILNHFPGLFTIAVNQGSQTHLGVGATLQDITQSVGRIVFRDDKMQ